MILVTRGLKLEKEVFNYLKKILFRHLYDVLAEKIIIKFR